MILFGTVMARSTMRAVNASLPVSSRFRTYTRLHEVMFWAAVAAISYGVYLLLTTL